MKKIFSLTLILVFSYTMLLAQQSFCSLAKTASLGKTDIATTADVEKMNKYDVYFYKLDVAVERNTTYISGNVEIHATVVKDLTEFVFELHDTLLIDSVLLEGQRYAFSRLNGIVKVVANRLAGSKLLAEIVYHGYTPQGQSAAIGNGFSNSLNPHEVTWSLSQPYAAYEWWPCKQVLTDKADSAEIWITTDASNKAGSNGLLVNTTTLSNNKKRYEWKTHYPIDYYLLSVAVSNYEEYNLYAYPAGASQPILIQNYIYDTAVKKALDFTPQLIEMYSPLYGMYPFALEKYGHSQAKINGGMEHQTMTTLGAFSFNVIAHELAHQWFGDYVTCGSWADIWLNEGFASYSEYVANEQLATGNALSWMDRAMNDAKATPESVYVLDTPNVPRIFDGFSTYHKGAVLLHMLRYEINNDSIFFLGLRNYLEANKFSTALGTDFRYMMEQTSGKEFGYFFDQWYYGKGYPVFSATWNQLNNTFYVNLTQVSTNNNVPVFKTTLDIRVMFTTGDTTIRVWTDSLSKIYSLDVTGKTITGIQLDANNWILNDVGTIKKDPLFNAVPNINGENDILVYPNPTADMLHVDHAQGYLIEVFDIAGKQLLNMAIDAQNKTLQLRELNSGIYILRIKKDGRISTMKLVKN